MSHETPSLRALRESAAQNRDQYQFQGPNANVLEAFVSPVKQQDGFIGWVQIQVPEFTSLCPITHQPDFATLMISYRPDKLCVESKALKLYLLGYRNHGAFHESCTQQIANDLVELLDPFELRIRGEFAPRGGIPFWPEIRYARPAAAPSSGN